MSTKFVKQEISHFLAGSDPEVVCLSGHWGVGKTYGWNYFLKQAKADGKIALHRYSYVSLFGINSMEEFKASLFENLIPVAHIGIEPNFEMTSSNLGRAGVEAGKKLTSLVQNTPFLKNYLGALGPLWFSSVRDQIVCIDDIERRGKGLSVRDVLGLASFLREQRHCRIMLILNDEALEEDKADFETYYEKVVDTTLTFAPTPNECAEIALSHSSPSLKFLFNACTALGIPNIRTIKKIERMLRKLHPWLKDMEESVWHQAVNSMTLLGWAVYDKRNAPPLHFILEHNPVYKYLPEEEQKMTEEQEAWVALMRKVDFISADDFDLALLDGIRAGFFDEERIEKLAGDLDKQAKNDKLHKSFKDAWGLFNGSFDASEDEVTQALHNSAIEHLNGINIYDIDPTVTLLENLGRADLADDLIMRTFATKDDVLGEIEHGKRMFHRQLENPKILAEVARLPAGQENRRPAPDILEDMAANQSWHPNDFPALAAMPIDEYAAVFKKMDGDKLTKLVPICWQIGGGASGSEHEREIASRASAALEKIAGESRLNRLRIENLYKRAGRRPVSNRQLLDLPSTTSDPEAEIPNV